MNVQCSKVNELLQYSTTLSSPTVLTPQKHIKLKEPKYILNLLLLPVHVQ